MDPTQARLRSLVDTLCSDRCAGRAPGSRGGRAAREAVLSALRQAGLDPYEQAIPGCGGANVLASLPGDCDRFVLVSAHYDHLGQSGSRIYRGADDNAAAVSVLVEVARALAERRPGGRGVLIAAFDSEEPPYFMSESMGSEYFARHPSVPLSQIDLMIGMDLIGHRLGSGEDLPRPVSESLFVLGSERSRGTREQLVQSGLAVPGLRIRPLDATIIPPLSDYHAFMTREIPFLFLTAGRSRYYHTVNDTPETLDLPKMAATAAWLERLVRQTCRRPEDRLTYLPNACDDEGTLRTLLDVLTPLRKAHRQADSYFRSVSQLLAQCDRNGRLPEVLRPMQRLALGGLEKLVE